MIDVETGKVVFSYSGVPGLLTAFSPRGELFAYVVGDNVRLTEANSRVTVGEISGAAKGLTQMAISDDARRLATIADGKITIWELPGGRPLLVLPAEDVVKVQFSPDGRSLIGSEFVLSGLGGRFPGTFIWRGATDEEVARQRGK